MIPGVSCVRKLTSCPCISRLYRGPSGFLSRMKPRGLGRMSRSPHIAMSCGSGSGAVMSMVFFVGHGTLQVIFVASDPCFTVSLIKQCSVLLTYVVMSVRTSLSIVGFCLWDKSFRG